MGFLSPFTLVALVSVAAPVAIHLLVRRRARRLDFPSLRLLHETKSFHLRLRSIRQPLLLALRVLALTLLIAGLAQPFLSFRSGRRRVLLIDASLSMRARGRVEAAKDRARAIIARLAPDERAAVISFSSATEALAPLTTNRDTLLRAVEWYQPMSGAADYETALAQAEKLLAAEPPGAAEIDLISDFQESNLNAGQGRVFHPVNAHLALHPIGERVKRNAFLEDLKAAAGGRGLQLTGAEIVNEDGAQRGGTRVWTMEGTSGAGPGIEWRTEANGQLTGYVETLTADDFDFDDRRFFAFTPPRRSRALLIEAGDGSDVYLRAAIEAAAEQDAAGLVPDVQRRLPAAAAELGAYALVVLTAHGAPPAEAMRALEEYARAGGVAWIFLARDADALSWAALAQRDKGNALPFAGLARIGEGQTVSFGALDADSPLLRRMSAGAISALHAVGVRSGFALAPGPKTDVLVRWSDGAPAFVATQVGAGTIAVLGTSADPAAADLGRSAAFPALVSSVAQAAGALAPLDRKIGEPVKLRVPPETPVRLTGADGRAVQTTARSLLENPAEYLREPGIYRVEINGREQFWALNAPDSESAPALASTDAVKGYFPVTEAKETEEKGTWETVAKARGRVWQYLLAASFLLFAGELFLSPRATDGLMSPETDAGRLRSTGNGS
jgi:hypothetical protein